LVVPEELSLFKKDGYQKDSENSDKASEEVFPDKSTDPTLAKGCNGNLTGRNVIENDVMKPVKCKPVVDDGMSNPEQITEAAFYLSDMWPNSTIKPSVPVLDEIDLQVNYISTVFMYLDDFLKKNWIFPLPCDITTRGCSTSEFTRS
jgi:ATP-dependent RNA helicase DHX37/DHR1